MPVWHSSPIQTCRKLSSDGIPKDTDSAHESCHLFSRHLFEDIKLYSPPHARTGSGTMDAGGVAPDVQANKTHRPGSPSNLITNEASQSKGKSQTEAQREFEPAARDCSGTGPDPCRARATCQRRRVTA